MDINRTLAAILLASLTCSPAFAIDIFKKSKKQDVDYTAWSDTVPIPHSENGKKIFFPVSEGDQAFIRGEIAIPGQNAEKIFLAALEYAADHLDSAEDHEQIGEFNPSEKSFCIRQYSRQGTNNNETTFTRLSLIKAENGRLTFSTSQIDAAYREKGIIPRTLAFEQLNPAGNNRHRELVEQFMLINSSYFHDMAESVGKTSPEEITHWDEIRNKEIVTGMTPFEVKLILGKPITARENGNRLRWVFEKNYVLLFENGKLFRIVE